ncbi:MAG: flagellar biosynthetic protein FliO [Burkholderiaceae bacterium]|nr:flagellar biosynthetic protein FliO [Burkholderiaceae bacterium]
MPVAPTLWIVGLFVGAMALLPWLVKRLQQRQVSALGMSGSSSKLLSTVAVGPQQRIVTLEVGPENERTWLILGVTAQQISCLHTVRLSGKEGQGALSAFSEEMTVASAAASGKVLNVS